ncbi:MAG: hypothetical protein A3B10_02980 [Candidatus Doudnabacteria bacterium RIFCSPLOWO2_01_FULL_44_21]|uniref:Ribosome-binding factor A n=1 Tax=Candidatus Doudnabacteria bacterium RIFCSPLOWO2_01_FULL_44_21 TaxID=1817841 RepID=A0A1F5Q326_9BACT|nr:MAG: hypothetical protein A3B10_02980 [Candidatus Doudnabacteria bacterium RIFCSPLOWO2_01_FULL_44_21]
MHKVIGEYLLRLELPFLTTISKVEVTSDLKWCKVWVTIMGPPAAQQETLKRISADLFDLQEELLHQLRMKIIPKVSFVLDHAEEYASHINELIRKTHEE